VKAIEVVGLPKSVIIADADAQKVVQHLIAKRASQRGPAPVKPLSLDPDNLGLH
jgi:hypothetical protein